MECGSIVKIILQANPPSTKYNAERLWVCVDKRNGDEIEGFLDSDPSDICDLKAGDRLKFNEFHIIDILGVQNAEPNLITEIRYELCVSDTNILDGSAPIRYLYREAPETLSDDPSETDTGWRFRSKMKDFAQEVSLLSVADIAIVGYVLNKDDSCLDLLSSPVGSRFVRLSKNGPFTRLNSPLTSAD